MPKRVVDGESLWQSGKLKKVSLPASVPASLYRMQVSWLLPLALANGSFECDPDLIWSRCYSYLCPDVTPEDVAKLLDELERAKILFRWAVDGRTWGYWVGIDKPGRLPKGTDYTKGKRGEKVPVDKLAAFLGKVPEPFAEADSADDDAVYREKDRPQQDDGAIFGVFR